MKRLPKDEVELGTVTALLERSSRRRIPRLLRIKKAVGNGKRLTNYQIDFLSKVFEDARAVTPYIEDHPELHDIAARMVSLYSEITEQAIKNEEAMLKKKAPPIDFPDK
jgi:hypothetical protein